MNISIQDIVCDDYPGVNDCPQDPCNVSTNIAVRIGAEDGRGADWFYFNLCTTAWISDQIRTRGYVAGRLVIVERFDWDEINVALNHLCASISALTWEEFVKQMQDYADWEFEGIEGP